MKNPPRRRKEDSLLENDEDADSGVHKYSYWMGWTDAKEDEWQMTKSKWKIVRDVQNIRLTDIMLAAAIFTTIWGVWYR